MKILIFLLLCIPYIGQTQILNGWVDPDVDTRIELLTNEIKEIGKKPYLVKELNRLKDIKEYSTKTSDLIAELKDTAPYLYGIFDSLKDDRGNKVKVYVQIVYWYNIPDGLDGITGFSVKDGVHYSKFGSNTVHILIRNNKKSLYTLAHELGHVYYQINNLSSYLEYFKANYNTNSKEIGHLKGDKSGYTAELFEILLQKHLNL